MYEKEMVPLGNLTSFSNENTIDEERPCGLPGPGFASSKKYNMQLKSQLIIS